MKTIIEALPGLAAIAVSAVGYLYVRKERARQRREGHTPAE